MAGIETRQQAVATTQGRGLNASGKDPAAWRWRFLASTDRTWRLSLLLPGFDPKIVECEPLFT